jgi:hypothetical protein
MRAGLIAVALVLAACAGPDPGPTGAPIKVANWWPLRGTSAPDGDAIHKRPLVV